MAKKRTIIDQEIPDKHDELLPDDAAQPQFYIELYKVYKITNGSSAFCFQTAEAIDEVAIQDHYPAGGKFKVLCYGADKVLLDTIPFEIEAKPLNSPTINHTGNAADVQVRMLLDELRFSREMILTMLKGGNNNQTPVAELVTAMQGIQSLTSNGKDPIELLIKGMELGGKSSASGDWKSELIHTAKEVLSPAVEAYSAFKQQNPPQQITANGEQKMLPGIMIKQGISWLKGRILTGMEPGLAVDWVITNGNDPMYQPFLSIAVNGTIDDFIKLDAEIANEPFKSWFISAIELIKEAYSNATAQTEHDDTSDHDGGNGNGSNVAMDAVASPRKPKLSKAV